MDKDQVDTQQMDEGLLAAAEAALSAAGESRTVEPDDDDEAPETETDTAEESQDETESEAAGEEQEVEAAKAKPAADAKPATKQGNVVQHDIQVAERTIESYSKRSSTELQRHTAAYNQAVAAKKLIDDRIAEIKQKIDKGEAEAEDHVVLSRLGAKSVALEDPIAEGSEKLRQLKDAAYWSADALESFRLTVADNKEFAKYPDAFAREYRNLLRMRDEEGATIEDFLEHLKLVQRRIDRASGRSESKANPEAKPGATPAKKPVAGANAIGRQAPPVRRSGNLMARMDPKAARDLQTRAKSGDDTAKFFVDLLS